MENTQKVSSADLFCWPDGTWCMRAEAAEYAHMSNDYSVLVADTPEWHVFLESQE